MNQEAKNSLHGVCKGLYDGSVEDMQAFVDQVAQQFDDAGDDADLLSALKDNVANMAVTNRLSPAETFSPANEVLGNVLGAMFYVIEWE